MTDDAMQQELFGGDSSLFNRTMETLDKMTSLDQAKDYLVEHVAIKQNWTEESKMKKAAHFIKLISRGSELEFSKNRL